MMLKRSVVSCVVGSVAAASLVFVSPVAYASPVPGDPGLTDTQVAAAVEKADPGVSSGGVVKSYTASGNRVSSGRVTMVLPGASGKVSTVSGTRTYRDAKASYAVRGTKDGIQALSVVSAADGPREFRYVFPGEYLTFEQGLVVVRAGSATAEPLAVIDPAWAKDANGKSVDTWYSIVDNSTLVQRINPTPSTTYPVVADPRWSNYWWGFQVDFTRNETSTLIAGFTGCAIIAGLSPIPIGKVIMVACGVLSAFAGYAYRQGQCLSFKWLVVPGSAIPWASNCCA
jgi:hypothetical protein